MYALISHLIFGQIIQGFYSHYCAVAGATKMFNRPKNDATAPHPKASTVNMLLKALKLIMKAIEAIKNCCTSSLVMLNNPTIRPIAANTNIDHVGVDDAPNTEIMTAKTRPTINISPPADLIFIFLSTSSFTLIIFFVLKQLRHTAAKNHS